MKRNKIEHKGILDKSFLASVCFLFLFTAFFMSCNDKEEVDIVPSPLAVTNVEEQFDKESNLYVRASFATSRPDTIASVGFVYTDAVETLASPVMGIDHTLAVSSFILDENAAPGTYFFEGLINPRRTSPKNYSWGSNIVAYVTTSSGKTYVSEVITIDGDKVKLVDIYPRHAPAGTRVKATLNRQFYYDEFHNKHLANSNGKVFDVFLVIGDQEMLMEGVDFGSDFYFEMPTGLDEETPVRLRIEEYEVEYSQTLKNTALDFISITEFKRDTRSGVFLFATPGSIYLGGGSLSTGERLTDFWKYEVATNQWLQVADYPSTGKERGMTFTIGDNAYCGNTDNFQRYNFNSNTWSVVSLPKNDLQYDHTFSSATSVVYDGKAYFSNFSTPQVAGGITYGNFWQFDPIPETYKPLPNITGIIGSTNYSDYMTQSVIYNNQLHFFRNMQHWRYNPQTTSWFNCQDVDQEGRDIKPFLFQGEMYGIVTTTIPNAILGSMMGKTYTIYKYNEALDSWTKDSDIPRTSLGEDINPMTLSFNIIQTSDTEVYLCLVMYGGFTFYKMSL